MFEVLGLFLQAAAGHVLYLLLHLESGSFPRPLSPAKEKEAFTTLRAGGEEAARARDLLIRHNLRLVAHVTKKYYAAATAQDDLISIGTIGLIKAVDTFNPDRASKFSSYASRCIENAILTKTPVWEFRLEQRNGFSSLFQNGRSLPGSRRIFTYSAALTTAGPASRPWPCTGSDSSLPETCRRPSGSPGSTTAMRR